MKTSIKHTLAMIAFLASTLVAQAQMKVGNNPTTINPGSLIEMESTNKGLLMPRISLTNTTTWGLAGTQVAGMHVYNTNTAITSSNTSYPTLAAKIGEYYWDGTGWVALAPAVKTTAVTSFSQTTGHSYTLANSSSGSGGQFCPLQVVGSTPPPACLNDLNRDGSFTTINPTNDVIVNITGNWSVVATAQVQFFILLYIDKTTPGVFELVDQYFVSTTAGCSGGYLNYLTALKNYPPRTYNVKVYEEHWYNAGTTAYLGIGAPAFGACGGAEVPVNQKLIISVSQ